MTRAGMGWDGLAAAALLLPLAGLAGRRLAVSGALASLAAWVALLAAGAAPAVGRFEPDALALAASAGTVLVAAAVAGAIEAEPRSNRPLEGLVAASVGPAAAAACLGMGFVDQPDLGRGAATALVVAGVVVAVLVAVGPSALRLFVPVALLAALRGASELVDPAAPLGLLLAGGAATLALAPARVAGRRLTGLQPAALAAAAVAVAVAPLPVVRPGGALLAAAAVLVAAAVTLDPPADGWPASWALLTAGPGAAVAATALADVPSPAAPAVAVHVGFAALLVVAAAGLVARAPARRPDTAPTRRRGGAHRAGARAAVVVLAAWLFVAPGSWRWAVPDPGRLAPWDRAAAVGAAAAAAGAVLVGLASRRERSAASTAQ